MLSGNEKLIILIATMDAHGHTNGCIAIGQALLSRGHRVVMETERVWKGRFQKFGIEEIYYGPERLDGQNKEALVDVIVSASEIFRMNWEDKVKCLQKLLKPVREMAMGREPEFKKIVEEINPDIIIVDSFSCSPAHVYSGKPWINMALSNPLFHLDDKRTPPAAYGLSCYEDQHLWESKREIQKELMRPQVDIVNAWLASQGYPPIEKTQPHSPYGNIYMYPEELDYIDLRPIPPNYYRVDCLVRNEPSDFSLPKIISEGIGKLILVSMGSHASADVELQKRILNEIKNLPHRFIFTTGPFGDQLELPDNVWGDKFLPQTKILPLVDVFITHGGNNSLTESLYFGVPVIILPIFGDQPDNAQRVQELNFGIRLDAFKCTGQELETAINYLTSNQDIKNKYKNISERLQKANCTERAAEIVEEVAKKYKNK